MEAKYLLLALMLVLPGIVVSVSDLEWENLSKNLQSAISQPPKISANDDNVPSTKNGSSLPFIPPTPVLLTPPTPVLVTSPIQPSKPPTQVLTTPKPIQTTPPKNLTPVPAPIPVTPAPPITPEKLRPALAQVVPQTIPGEPEYHPLPSF